MISFLKLSSLATPMLEKPKSSHDSSKIISYSHQSLPLESSLAPKPPMSLGLLSKTKSGILQDSKNSEPSHVHIIEEQWELL